MSAVKMEKRRSKAIDKLESESLSSLVRRHTGYKDKNGKPIIEGDTLQGWFAAPWDNEQPILRNFRVCKESGRWWCHGVETREEDDFLPNMLYLEHKST